LIQNEFKLIKSNSKAKLNEETLTENYKNKKKQEKTMQKNL